MSQARRRGRNRHHRLIDRAARRQPPLYCHGGAGHDHATDRGAAGAVCDRCYAAYLKITHRGPVSLFSGSAVAFTRLTNPMAKFRVVIDERT